MAEDYPLGRLADEAAMIVERENGRIVTEANLLQLAISGIFSSKARTLFTKSLNELTVETKPLPGLFDDEEAD